MRVRGRCHGGARGRFLRVAARVLAGGLALAAAAALAVVLWIVLAPRPPLLDGVPFSPVVLDRHGEVLRIGLAADGRYRLRVRLAEVAPETLRAILRYEDRFFYRHPGVNPLALVRAAGNMLAGGRRMGGSTLTMQVVRLRQGIVTSRAGGKIAQILAALQLECHYDKEAILEAYCNLAPYGGNVEGLEAAARIYFHKPARRLTGAESLALAVVPQHPARRHPLRGPDFDTARERLAALIAADRASCPAGRRVAGQAPPPLRVFSPAELPFKAPHATAEAIRLMAENGESGGIIRTTLDLPAQQTVERLIRQFADRGRPYGLDNAAALLVHWPSMEIRALAGSASFGSTAIQGQVDGTRARRSPGSTLKPFIYALALDQGLIHPMSLLVDSPRSFGGYDPENFDRTFRGPLSAREALLSSRNIPAISLASSLRAPGLYGFLRRAGVALPFPEEHYGLSLVLGGAEVSMRDLARLYAMLANQGMLRDLRLLAGPAPGTPRAGEGPPSAAGPRRMLSPEAAFMTLTMLESEGRTARTRRGSVPLRLKTGTSNGFRDAWTVGIFGQYVLAVWVGHFDNRANRLLVGGEVAEPLFRDIAGALAATDGDLQDPVPEQAERLHLERIEVCAATGDVDTGLCPDTTTTWFWPGVSPVRPSGVFRTILVDVESGLRACAPLPGRTKEVTWEFWPTDLQRLFLRAGVVKPPPPPFDLAGPTCAGRNAGRHGGRNAAPNDGGRPPDILVPKEGVVYQIRLSEPGRSRIPLTAATEADAGAVFWFAGGRFLGRTPPGEPLAWTPPPGLSELRAVDDRGRASLRRLHVESVP